MINQFETESGLESREDIGRQENQETLEDRESIVLAFELEEAADPGNPRDAVEVLKKFLDDVRAFLNRLHP